jgi:hypothetical protein
MTYIRSLGHTVGACIACIVIYLIMIYVGTPIIDRIMTWFGTYFVPERYGGGTSAAAPGLLSSVVRGMLQTGISAYCAIKGSVALFSNSNRKIIAVVLGLFAVLGTIMFTLVFMKKDGIIALIIPVILSPTLYLAFMLWKEEEI